MGIGIPIGWVLRPDGTYGKPKRPKPTPFMMLPPPAAPPAVQKVSKEKYHRSPAADRTVCGLVFASKLEAKAYVFLKQAGAAFEMQVPYELQEKFQHEGKTYQPIRYVCDFLIKSPDGKSYVVDMKGMILPEFKRTAKMFLFKYKYPIHCIKTVKELGEFLHKHHILS